MKKYLITIYNDLNGDISYEKHIKSNLENIKKEIIEVLQDPKVKVGINDNILIQEEEKYKWRYK